MSQQITDQIIATDIAPSAAGRFVWWRLSGAVTSAVFRAAWAREGLDPATAPAPPSPKVAFSRAVRAVATPRRLVRPLENGGTLIVDERDDGQGGLTWQPIAAVRLDPGKQRPAVDRVTPEAIAVFDAIQEAFDVALVTVESDDVSTYLARKMPAFEAVSLRDTGGVYFVPQPQVDRWEAVVRAFRGCSAHMVANVPAMAGDEAAIAILDAITAEVTSTIEAINAEVTDGELGPRALETRADRAAALASKLAGYEKLLGRKVEGLGERVEALRAGVSAALLSAGASDAAA